MAKINAVTLGHVDTRLTHREVEALQALLRSATGTALKGVESLGRVKAEFQSIGATGAGFTVTNNGHKLVINGTE